MWRKPSSSAHSTSLLAERYRLLAERHRLLVERHGLLVLRHHVVDRYANRRIRPRRPTLGRDIALAGDRIFVQRLLTLRAASSPCRMIAHFRGTADPRAAPSRTNPV